jgi:hypothetical protein
VVADGERVTGALAGRGAVLQKLGGAQSSEIGPLRRSLREAQLEARGLYGELSQRLRQAALGQPAHAGACQELKQQQHLIDAAGSMLALLTRSLTPAASQ